MARWLALLVKERTPCNICQAFTFAFLCAGESQGSSPSRKQHQVPAAACASFGDSVRIIFYYFYYFSCRELDARYIHTSCALAPLISLSCNLYFRRLRSARAPAQPASHFGGKPRADFRPACVHTTLYFEAFLAHYVDGRGSYGV